jgi:hypothetical protein
MKQVTLNDCINAWNQQTDEFNQWTELDSVEQCEWCLKMAQVSMIENNEVGNETSPS